MRGRKNPPAPAALVSRMTLAEVCHLVQFAPRTILRWVSEGRFPAPGPAAGTAPLRGSKQWLRSDVEAWVAARAEDRGGSP